MEIWTTSPIVICMACRHGIREAGIHALERLHAALKHVRDYRHCGKPNCTMVNWVMLIGEDVEVKNAISVQPNASEDVGFSKAVICHLFLKTMYVLQMHRTFILSTNRNTMLHEYEPYILQERKKVLFYGVLPKIDHLLHIKTWWVCRPTLTNVESSGADTMK